MLFPKFVPSCSQSWALFCIWNVRNALLHSLSHLDTLICKGCKERENTAGARMNLQHISFYCHCHLSHGCELGCGCCSAPRWLWAAACLPTAFQASRSCTKSPWRYSADTCLPQQCCPAGRGVTAPHSAAWPAQPKLLTCTRASRRTLTHPSCVQGSCSVGNGNRCRDGFSLWTWVKNWLWEWVWFSLGFCQGCLSGSGHTCKEHHGYLEFSLTVSFKPPHQQLFYYLCNFFLSFSNGVNIMILSSGSLSLRKVVRGAS